MGTLLPPKKKVHGPFRVGVEVFRAKPPQKPTSSSYGQPTDIPTEDYPRASKQGYRP